MGTQRAVTVAHTLRERERQRGRESRRATRERSRVDRGERRRVEDATARPRRAEAIREKERVCVCAGEKWREWRE